MLAGDGQVTLGSTVVKHGARKIRRLYNESILAGFAGSAADSFALFSRSESKLEQYREIYGWPSSSPATGGRTVGCGRSGSDDDCGRPQIARSFLRVR